MSNPVTVEEVLDLIQAHLIDADHPHADADDFEANDHYPSIHLAERCDEIEGETKPTLGLLTTTGERFFITIEED